MLIENVNDILAFITLACFIVIPLYFILKKGIAVYRNMMDRRIQRLMKEDDWHM